MAWFDFLKPKNCEHYPDSFALTRDVLYDRLREIVQRQTQMEKVIFLVAHFPDEFFRLQEQLSRWQMDYQILAGPIDEDWFRQQQAIPAGTIILGLVEFMTGSLNFPSVGRSAAEGIAAAGDQPLAVNRRVSFPHRAGIMVLDRHPLLQCEAAVAEFAEAFPQKTELGYFAALDDFLVRNSISDTTIQVLKQLGMEQHGLVSSHLITKHITRALNRQFPEGTPNPSADSVEEWLGQSQAEK